MTATVIGPVHLVLIGLSVPLGSLVLLFLSLPVRLIKRQKKEKKSKRKGFDGLWMMSN